MNQKSKEELRFARLKALGLVGPETTNVIVTSTATETVPQLFNLDRQLLDVMWKVVYVGGFAVTEDMIRWNYECFRFYESPNFGLQQSSGGPCSILAVIQAEIIKLLFLDHIEVFPSIPTVTHSQVVQALVSALTNVLYRICSANKNKHCNLVIFTSTPNLDIPPECWDSDCLQYYSCATRDQLQDKVQQHIDQYQGHGGCWLLLLSAIMTRGVENLKGDMDDPMSKLIGQFGHSNQEVINLLLTGKATSNSFDGEIALGDGAAGMSVKGVLTQTEIGYLSHMEALRYCQVGKYLKIPKFPIWVIGSSSHFTVLFALNKDVNEESNEEKLLSSLQRCFKSMDKDECGFIPSHKLLETIQLINLHHEYDPNHLIFQIANDPVQLARLRGYIQMDGEIILWQSFWINLSKLIMGRDTLDSLISCSTTVIDATASSSSSLTSATNRPRSDSEIARALQAQFDQGDNENTAAAGVRNNEYNNNAHKIPRTEATNSPVVLYEDDMFDNGNSHNNSSNNSSGTAIVTRPRSDSELARELQAQFDSELDPLENNHTTNQNNSTNNSLFINSAPVRLLATTPTNNNNNNNNNNAAQSNSSSNNHEHSPPVMLYHYNGLLRSSSTSSTKTMGQLTTVQLHRRVKGDIIGQAVPLECGEQGNGFSSNNRPIEEVLRTRWPGCQVTWEGSQPPSID